MIAKSSSLWAVITPQGEVLPETFRKRRDDAINAAASVSWRWEQLKKVGFRCCRVKIEVQS